jgi:hypothetical protein
MDHVNPVNPVRFFFHKSKVLRILIG